MTRPIHPDELNRVAASRGGVATAPPASLRDVEAALDRALATGRLARIPRNPRHRDVVLAILCLGMQRRHRYTEPEVNGHLADALDSFGAAIDHVTCRRYLIDLGFLKRDRAGTRYFLNYPKVEATLSAAAADAAATLIAARVRRGPSRGTTRAP